MSEQGTYLYAVAGGPEPPVGDLTGVSGGQVRFVPHHEVTAVVSSVGLDEFGEAGLRRNLEDLDWLDAVARAHGHVVDAVAALVPVVPLRLATVCFDDDSVRTKLDEWQEQIDAVLTRITGRVEWGVKAYLETAGAAEADDVPANADSGTTYLMHRRAQARRRDESTRAAAELTESLHAELAAVAVASTRHAAQDQRLSGHEGTMILNGAYLVDTNGGTELADLVDRLSTSNSDVRLELTGPWPAYSFAGLDTQ